VIGDWLLFGYWKLVIDYFYNRVWVNPYIYMLWCVLVATFILDQLSKFYICRGLSLGQSVPVFKDIFHLSLVYNTGSVFGLFRGKNSLLIIFSLGIIYFIFRDYFLNKHSYVFKKRLALYLILGGALGNLLDRLRLGYIVDFLDFRVWPVFNLADSAITIGVFLLAIDLLVHKSHTS